jgi:OOP family OmpA-OmpF porin
MRHRFATRIARRSARRITRTCALGAGLAASLGLVLATSRADAQLAMRTWRPSTDADASMVLEPTRTPGPANWNLGLWTQYMQFPPFDCCGGTPPSAAKARTTDRFGGVDLVTGIGIGSRFAIGFEVPSEFGSSGFHLGDPSVTGKVTLISNDRDGVSSGFGLAAKASVFLVGDAELDDSLVFGTTELDLLGEFAVGIGALRAELGYEGPAAVTIAYRDEDLGPGKNPLFQDIIPWAIGADVRPKVFTDALDNGDRQLWEIAFHGSLPGRGPTAPFSQDASAVSPVLFSFDDRVALGHHREVLVTAGAEIGLDHATGVPAFRAVVGLGWAPRSHDKDEDGIDDEADQCPDLPEDRDGLQDADGCPEDDADGDSILDTDDACPLVPGVPSDDKKKNGCPP